MSISQNSLQNNESQLDDGPKSPAVVDNEAVCSTDVDAGGSVTLSNVVPPKLDPSSPDDDSVNLFSPAQKSGEKSVDEEEDDFEEPKNPITPTKEDPKVGSKGDHTVTDPEGTNELNSIIEEDNNGGGMS